MTSSKFVPIVSWLFWFIYQDVVSAKLCNVALCRPTNQTSLHPNYNHTLASSCNAVDGIYDSNIDQQSCIYTHWDPMLNFFPSWQIDLGDIYNIAYISITLRQDGYEPKYVKNILIKVGNSLTSAGELINPLQCVDVYNPPTNLGTPLKLFCNTQRSARYLRIEKEDLYFSWLSFCELEVFSDITDTYCPDPPKDWTCRDLTHTSTTPRSQCVETKPTTQSSKTTMEVVTTTETVTTTAQITTTEDVTTTETVTTKAPIATTEDVSTTETITTAVPTTPAKEVSTTETITSAVPTTVNSVTTTKLEATPINSISEPDNMCYCPCNSGGYLVLTDAELQEKIEKIISEIKVDPKGTSLAKRKLISADDSRPSAKAVGSLGIVILVVIAGFIVIMDSDVIYRSIEQFIARRKKNKSIEEN
ncbi:uncharacterized protein LOC134722305 [Mytilus trossulus]|uniref:uncharacterized protein LOC134722305 n=1 Tax=Mytilus trossulus TaxID=6551 RepID=UPI003006B70A